VCQLFLDSSNQTSSFTGKTAIETHKTLENINGNKVLSCACICELLKLFRQGCEDLVNNSNSRWQSSVQNPGTVAKLHEMLTTDCWMALKLMKDQMHAKH
jgi:hypothetical protein